MDEPSNDQVPAPVVAPKQPELKHSRLAWFKKHRIWSGIIVLFVLIIIGSASSGDKNDTGKTAKSNQVTNQASTKMPTPTAQPVTPKEPELSYEVLSQAKAGSVNRVEVYTTETNDEILIKLNDKLTDKYKNSAPIVFIDYFNDKSAAEGYFDKQLDDSVSEATKNELYKHYIANMVYNTNTGLKQLVRQGGTQKTLKTY